MKVDVKRAAELLLRGEVVAVPTETVYGLAASLAHPLAIDKVFSLKKRPSQNPLIIHIAHLAHMLHFLKEQPPHFEDLTHKFWPGPLSLVLSVNEQLIPEKVRANLPTAAFRIPAHPTALALLELTGPLVMPSANLSGKPSATQSRHVEEDFGESLPLLEGGNCQQGLESTILIYHSAQWHIIRQGILSGEDFASLLGYTPTITLPHSLEKPLCPGQSFKHYAPQARLILCEKMPHELNEVILGFEEREYAGAAKVILLGSLSQAKTVSANLYTVLRQLDREKIEVIWVDFDLPYQGLWSTIRERLQRAARIT